MEVLVRLRLRAGTGGRLPAKLVDLLRKGEEEEADPVERGDEGEGARDEEEPEEERDEDEDEDKVATEAWAPVEGLYPVSDL